MAALGGWDQLQARALPVPVRPHLTRTADLNLGSPVRATAETELLQSPRAQERGCPPAPSSEVV